MGKLDRFAGFCWATLAFNVLVVLWGAFVRATGSGAGCGSHWPRCNGVVVPRVEETATLIEFAHRLSSGVALLLVVVMWVWARRARPRGHPARGGALASLALILVEAALGAGLVLFGLVADNASPARAAAMSAHLVNTFLLLGALTLTAWWASGGAPLRLHRRDPVAGLLLGGAAGVLLVGVSGAIAALGDTLFPATSFAEGVRQELEPGAHLLLRLRVLHPLIAVGVGVYLCVAAGTIASLRPSPTTRRLARTLVVLFVVQVAGGIANVLLLAPVWMQLVHLLLADAVWLCLVLLGAAALAKPVQSAAMHPFLHHERALRIPRALLRLPLFYKILLANAAIVLLGTIFGSTVTASYVRDEPGRSTLELVGVLAVVGVVVSVAVNAVILRLALIPLQLLERTAAAVQAGDTGARAPLSPLADRELERLTRTLNGMLDAMEAYRGRLREVAVRALNAAEEERKRVARELHDETAQTLAALLIRIRVARGRGAGREMEPLLEGMREEIGRALEGVRRFAQGLRPPALDELGLVPAVELHARTLSEAVEVEIAVSAEPLDGVLAREGELALYRIVQEALSNVVRHSGAARVRVGLGAVDGAVRATIEDDGRGFRVAETMTGEGSGLGLFGMRERAAYLGGRVEFDSVPGGGTTVRVEIPVQERALAPEPRPPGGAAGRPR
jgi:signal transduction histidine kinase